MFDRLDLIGRLPAEDTAEIEQGRDLWYTARGADTELYLYEDDDPAKLYAKQDKANRADFELNRWVEAHSHMAPKEYAWMLTLRAPKDGHISKKTIADMDKAVANMKAGKVSEPADLSDF